MLVRDNLQDPHAVMVHSSPRQFEHTLQLLFVKQLALELANQLDVASDASSRQFASVVC